MIKGWDNRSYFGKLGDAISQLGNALIGGAPDESLSGRSWRETELEDQDWNTSFWRLIRFAAEAIFYWRDKGNHCRLAFEEDIIRSSLRAQALPTIIERYNDAGYAMIMGEAEWLQKIKKS
jgi:hypothetical protein